MPVLDARFRTQNRDSADAGGLRGSPICFHFAHSYVHCDTVCSHKCAKCCTGYNHSSYLLSDGIGAWQVSSSFSWLSPNTPLSCTYPGHWRPYRPKIQWENRVAAVPGCQAKYCRIVTNGLGLYLTGNCHSKWNKYAVKKTPARIAGGLVGPPCKARASINGSDLIRFDRRQIMNFPLRFGLPSRATSACRACLPNGLILATG